MHYRTLSPFWSTTFQARNGVVVQDSPGTQQLVSLTARSGSGAIDWAAHGRVRDATGRTGDRSGL